MKLAGLTGLRGLAALIVVYYHLSQHRSTIALSERSWDIYQFTEHLVFVVSIFFVFSGFFRSLSYWKLWKKDIEPPRFLPSLRERFLRIAPVYYLALFLTFALVIVWQGFSFDGFMRLLSGVFFLSWISPETFFPVEINGPLWFIAYDMIGWIIVSLFMGYVVRQRKMVSIILLFILGFLVLLVLHFLWIALPWSHPPGIVGVWFPTYNPFLFGLHFLLGAGVGGIIEWMKRKNIHPQFIFDALTLNSFIFLFLFLWGIRETSDWSYSWPEGPYHFPYTMIAILTLIICLPYSKILGRILDISPLRFFAKIAFPLYTIHVLVIEILRKYFFTGVQLEIYNWSFFSIITLILATSLAWCIHKYVEMREWSKS